MIQPIKNSRRTNADKKKWKPDPCWAQAFMIKLLYENAMLKQQVSGEPCLPQIKLSLKQLRQFEALKSDNQTKLTFDKVAETVTITAPEAVMPEKSRIIHNKGIETPN